MLITGLTPQRKDKYRLNLYVDNQFREGIDIGTAARLGLYEGKEINEKLFLELNTEEEYQMCMNSALRLASLRPQSEREYWQKLGRKYSKQVIGRCLDRLRVLGYADDLRFAEIWIKERSKSRGTRLLKQELGQKGISVQIIENLLTANRNDDDFENAIELAKKKYNPDYDRQKNYIHISNLLSRRGYDYSIIKQVLNTIIN